MLLRRTQVNQNREFSDRIPNLRNLKLEGRTESVLLYLDAFKRRSITSIDLQITEDTAFALDVWTLLTQMPLLEKLRLVATHPCLNYWSGRRSIEKHTSLSEFHLEGDSHFILQFFPVINCTSANLSRLEIREKGQPLDKKKKIIPLILPHLPKLEHLVVETFWEPEALCERMRMDLTSSLGRLRTLEIMATQNEKTSISSKDTVPLLSTFLQKLLGNPDRGTSPSLHELSLRYLNITHEDTSYLIALSNQVCLIPINRRQAVI